MSLINRVTKLNLLKNNVRFASQYKLFITQDEDCFIARHPDVDFPYANTKPLPEKPKEEETLLKVNSRNMFVKSPNLEQLQSITYTPAAYWKRFEGKIKREAYKASQDGKE